MSKILDKKVGRFNAEIWAHGNATITADNADDDGQHRQLFRHVTLDDMKDLHYLTGRAIEAVEEENRKWAR